MLRQSCVIIENLLMVCKRKEILIQAGFDDLNFIRADDLGEDFK